MLSGYSSQITIYYKKQYNLMLARRFGPAMHNIMQNGSSALSVINGLRRRPIANNLNII